jgi:hypothetical protein
MLEYEAVLQLVPELAGEPVGDTKSVGCGPFGGKGGGAERQ